MHLFNCLVKLLSLFLGREFLVLFAVLEGSDTEEDGKDKIDEVKGNGKAV